MSGENFFSSLYIFLHNIKSSGLSTVNLYSCLKSFFGNGKLTVINDQVVQTQDNTFILVNKPFNNFKCDQEYGYEPKELFKNVNTITSEKDLYFLPYFGKDSKAVTILLSGDSEYYIYIVMDTVSKKYRVFEKNKCGVLPKELLQ